MAIYKCSECGTEYATNLVNKCEVCGAFGTKRIVAGTEDKKDSKGKKQKQVKIEDIKAEKVDIISYEKTKKDKNNKIFSIDESFNTFFGGGLTKGSINLISGLPGVGKSTFLGYLGKFFPDKKVTYISAEETTSQIIERLLRMKKDEKDFSNMSIYNESILEQISAIINKENPDILIIDSLQMLSSENNDGEKGGLKQQKYIIDILIKQIKESDTSLFLVGHVTKNNEIGGAQFIEHAVDAVIKIEPAGERGDDLKIMTNLKNRFSGEDILIYEMYEDDIKIVSNKKMLDLFIQEAAVGEPGNSLSVSVLPKSNQIILIEIQSIVSPKDGAFSKRIINKFDRNEFENIVKIIGDNLDSGVYEKDVNINIFSPLKQNGTELTLSIIMSIFSHMRQINLEDYIFIGRVGFRGEIKSINRQRAIIEKLKSYGISENKIISNNKYKDIKEVANFFIKKNKGKK